MEPANIKAILATRFRDYAIAPFRQPALHAFLGDGIFTTDGPHWAASRAMIRPNFARELVADLGAFEAHFQDLLAAVEVAQTDASGAAGEGFDLQELFFRFTIDSATEFLFGKSVRSLSAAGAGDAERRFAEAFAIAQAEGLDLIRLGPLARVVGARKRLQTGEKAVNVVHQYVDQFVDEAVRFREGLEKGVGREVEQEVEQEVVGGEEKGKYVFLHELAKQTKNKRRLRDELLNVLLAGRDTTASLLGNLFWVLSKRPDVWKKLREEVEEQLSGTIPTYEKLRGMKYLKWCLNESLRLHPVVPLNSRMCVADTVLPLGGGPDGKAPVFVKKGTITSYSVWAMHRRKDIYGPDADEFRPERWETLRVGWEYLPFNGGPRICVGQQYALTEASFVTVRLAQEFKELRSTDPHDEWQEQIALTLCSGRGCKVALVPA
ncbi:Cytochrome P450 [Macrophomina phaseolina MS6]|uniref:Cytochrome P450 n=1 Tax=Macrophomina phaseolina (strain MS6) TaxID=1126212 RepID=K2S0W5_MACPH|nr:Cytochrome P450 [Macrophomina phaseolina MS6]